MNVLDGVLISTIQAFVVRLNTKSKQFFVCYYSPMDEFKLKLFELSVLQILFNDLKILLQVSLFIDRFLLQRRGPV